MPPQPISIFYFIFMFSAHALSKHGCQERCGNLSIPYPFGIGQGCSLDPPFDIACRTSSSHDSPTPYLSHLNAEVIEINQTYIRAKYPNLISACYDSSGYKSSSMSVNLSGSPYTFSRWNWLTAIGCDDMLLQYYTNGITVSGGCSAFCAEKNGVSGFGYCPINETSVDYGCCETEIINGADFLGARLGDLTGKLRRTRLFPCSHAFIREMSYLNETVFSYPLHYLDNSTALVNDNWASTRSPVVRLNWRIRTAENCSEAKQNPNTYACRDNKSVCIDDFDSYEFGYQYSGVGYLCNCVPGYEGNPYLVRGCQAISFSSSIAKKGCQDQCGKIAIPYPFGVGPHCSLAPSFDISCNTSTNPPKAYLTILNKTITNLTSSQVQVIYPNLGFSCYNVSDNQPRFTKTDVRTLVIDLSGTEYTLSDENRITTIGCEDMVVASIGHTNRSFISSTCGSICQDPLPRYGSCPQGTSGYYPGDGCCRSPIPKGTISVKATLTDFSGLWPRTNFSCGYAFVSYPFANEYANLNNSKGIPLDNIFEEIDSQLALDWRIGSKHCKEAKRNPATFACGANSDCIDFDAMVGGYLCNCSQGYQGNPYLSDGCKDIDECADNTTNPCNLMSSCFNTPGSFYCSCPKGYSGDGLMKDGSGCIQLLKSKSKMIILTGMGSGLGFLLLVLMCFWLYKMLQKREEKMLREKFFKRNGGLLLRQQTNEGTLGKTKVSLQEKMSLARKSFCIFSLKMNFSEELKF